VRPTARPTVRTVLDIPALGLVLRAGREAIDEPVRWVAVSELEDPTPYLDGGELLLTTGLRLGDRDWVPFVGRLSHAGVSGLGLGIGLTHARMPAALVDAATAAGLPLLEVPEPTPFIAISRSVSDLIAAAEYEAVTRTVETQRDLTRAALAPEGAAAVVARLAVVLDADLVLLDPSGRLLHAAPREAADWVQALEPEIEAMRHRGPRSSAAFAIEGRQVVVQPLAPAGRVRGFLAVARAESEARSALGVMGAAGGGSAAGTLTTAELALVNVGVALVSLAMERSIGTDTARRELRSALVELLADGISPERLPVAGVGWDELLSGPVRVLVADGPDADLVALIEQVEDSDPAEGWRGAAPHDGRVVVLQPAAAPTAPPDLPAARRMAWGISDVVAVDALGDGLRQATRALAAAGPGGVRTFGDLARDGLVGLVDVDAGRGFADSLLGPLESRERGDLVASVRAWLAHHGQWDAAATTLGVHRHTLRYRMRRVEELLDRSLDDPDLRAELWVALAVRDRDASGR
jgi:purine catabolism regulator